MGGSDSERRERLGRGAPGADARGAGLNDIADLDEVFRAHWWGAVATVTRLVGDLAVGEDAVQDACLAALDQWPAAGTPVNPRAWLVGVARHKALDRLRREARRVEKEAAAMRELDRRGVPAYPDPLDDDELGLIFMCCHPALDPAVRVPLTLRSVCGLATAEIAAAFLVPEPTIAKRLVRAKNKIRQAGIPFRVPPPDELPARLAAVLGAGRLPHRVAERALHRPARLHHPPHRPARRQLTALSRGHVAGAAAVMWLY